MTHKITPKLQHKMNQKLEHKMDPKLEHKMEAKLERTREPKVARTLEGSAHTKQNKGPQPHCHMLRISAQLVQKNVKYK